MTLASGTTIEIDARQAPWPSRMGAAMQATEKSDSPAWMESPCSSAAAALRASCSLSVSARPVGDTVAERPKISSLSASDRCPTSRRPEAVQFSGERVPTRGDLEMVGSLLHREHDHVVAVAAADLHRLADFAAELVHLVARFGEEIERALVGEAEEVEARPEPDVAVGTAREQLALDQFVDDQVGRRERRADRLGDGIGAGGSADLAEMVHHLEGAVDAADPRAARRGGRCQRCGFLGPRPDVHVHAEDLRGYYRRME